MQKNKTMTPNSVWQDPIHFITFGFGSGAMPFAPGTFGTLAAIPFYLIFHRLDGWQYLIVTIVVVLLAIYLCGRTCKEIGVHDHPGTVLDEFAGFFVTMIGAPKGWMWIVIGFILFRIFDIWKPAPIAWMDKNMHGGLGVVLDDVLAGVYALIVIQILVRIF